MKGILNVLYRRILYKIPLKFLLLLLAIGALFFASCNSEYMTITSVSNSVACNDCSVNASTHNSDLVCLVNVGCSNNDFAYNYDHGDGAFHMGGVPINKLANGLGICSQDVIYYSTNRNCEYMINYVNIDINAILEDNVDNNYCENNGLCPVIDSSYCEDNNLCPVYTGDCENSSGVNWSSLYINDIQHLGGPNIYIGIPEEISRDYDYIDEDMYINVSGYNVDYDKITGIINTQNYKPTTEDFNYIVSSVIPLFVPGLVIILFLYWIFRFIKKIF